MIKKINDWYLTIDDKMFKKLKEQYKTQNITPSYEDLFYAFEIVKFDDVNVIIIGQDPYPRAGDAHGLSFSVKRNTKLPPSLKNIYKELENDLGIKRINGDLTKIAKQGVLFLNMSLTTEIGKPGAHKNIGWGTTTSKIIKDLSGEKNKIFVLLGNDAQLNSKYIDKENNIIIKYPHPSPLSAYRGFLGSEIFSKINNELIVMRKNTIKWND